MIDKIFIIDAAIRFANRQSELDGGKGSGNFGHSGREGQVGGSAPEGEGGGVGGASPTKEAVEAMKEDVDDAYMFMHISKKTKERLSKTLAKYGTNYLDAIEKLKKEGTPEDRIIDIRASVEVNGLSAKNAESFMKDFHGSEIEKKLLETMFEQIGDYSKPEKLLSFADDGDAEQLEFLHNLAVKYANKAGGIDEYPPKSLLDKLGIDYAAPKRATTPTEAIAMLEKSITDKSTAAEVQDALAHSGIFKEPSAIDLSGMNDVCAVEASKSFSRAISRFPMLFGEIRSIKLNDIKERVFACAGLYTRDIELNRVHFSNQEQFEETYAYSVETGFHPKGTTWASVVDHELGHIVESLSQAQVDQKLGQGKMTVSEEILRRVSEEIGYSASRIQSSVSGYAETDTKEWFAECVAEYMTSKNPRITCVLCMDFLDEIMGEYGA